MREWRQHGDSEMPPEELINRPILFFGLELYLDAFYELDSERVMGFSAPSRISWSSVVRYAEYHGFDKYLTDRLLYFIKKMDTAFLKKIGEKDGKDTA